VAAAGCGIEFAQKYTTKGEKLTDAHLPVILTPCCGTWHRFSFSDWGPDGYRCRACSQIRNTGPALSSICAVCGCENRVMRTGDGSRATTSAGASGSKKSESAKQIRSAVIRDPSECAEQAVVTRRSTWVCQAPKWLSPGAKKAPRPARKRAKLLDGKAIPTQGETDRSEHKYSHRKGQNDEEDDNAVEGSSQEEEEQGKEQVEDLDQLEKSDAAEQEEEDQHDEENVPEDEDKNLTSSLWVRSTKKAKSYDVMYQAVSGLRGTSVPSTGEDQEVITVIDDDVTSMILPITVCRSCFFESKRAFGEEPPLLSRLRKHVKRRLKQLQEKRSWRGAGCRSRAKAGTSGAGLRKTSKTFKGYGCFGF
jgi:hypothetical protein